MGLPIYHHQVVETPVRLVVVDMMEFVAVRDRAVFKFPRQSVQEIGTVVAALVHAHARIALLVLPDRVVPAVEVEVCHCHLSC